MTKKKKSNAFDKKQLEDIEKFVKDMKDENTYIAYCQTIISESKKVMREMNDKSELIFVPRTLVEQLVTDFLYYVHQVESKDTLQGVPISMVLLEHHNNALLLLDLANQDERGIKQSNNTDK